MTKPNISDELQPANPVSPIVDLYEAINLIAEMTEIPEDVIRDINCVVLPRTDTSRSRQLQASLLAGSLKLSYRRWKAAATLHFCLNEDPSNAPKWRNWWATGMPAQIDTDEQKKAMSFLECIAQDSEGRLNAYLSGKYDGNLNQPRNLPPLFSESENRWINCLGFERIKLAEMLDHAGISHNLVGQKGNKDASNSTPTPSTELAPIPGNNIHGTAAPTSTDVSKENSALLTPETVTVRNANQLDGFSNMVKNLTEHTPASVAHEVKSSFHGVHKHNRNVLADLIETAQAQAGEKRKEAGIVYPILISMAESGNYRPRLVGFEPRKGIKYLSGIDYKYYTQNALHKYLNPEARGTKKSPAKSDIKKSHADHK